MHVSLAELARTLPDALRGLGLGFAQADRATEGVLWAEAVHGLGLRFLRERGDAISATSTARAMVHRQRTSGDLVIHELDAAGRSLLESAPHALDLANADAGNRGIGVTRLERSFGLILAGELVYRSLRRGHALLICMRTDARTSRDPFEGEGLLLGLGTSPADPREDGAGPTDAGALIATFAHRIAGRAGAGAAATACAVLEHFQADSPRAGSDMLLLSAPLSHATAATTQPRMLSSGGPPGHWLATHDHHGNYTRSLREGLSVSEADWRALGDCVQRIRVPTSERSRAQAG